MVQVTEIKAFIAQGDIEAALNQLQLTPILDWELQTTVLKIAADYSRSRKDAVIGILSTDKAREEDSKINWRILELLSFIEMHQTNQPFHEAYEAGRKKLIHSDYRGAIASFEQVPPAGYDYHGALHNICLAKFAIAETEADMVAVFKMLNDLEDLIINAPVFNYHLLERLLFNRAMMAQQINLAELTKQDLEKLNLMRSPLGTPYQ